jgi:hypothetical protein
MAAETPFPVLQVPTNFDDEEVTLVLTAELL